MTPIHLFFLFYLGFTISTTNGFSEDADYVQNWLMKELENTIAKGGLTNGFDPLRISYLPIPIKKHDIGRDVDGFLILENLTIRGLSTVDWKIVYNSTDKSAQVDFVVPRLTIEIDSCDLELTMIKKTFGLSKATPFTMTGSGEFISSLENFAISLKVHVNEKKSRLRVTDCDFHTQLDKCKLFWDDLIIDGETVDDWEMTSSLVLEGIEMLNEDYVAPYFEETLILVFNMFLLVEGSTPSDVPNIVESLGASLVM